MTSSKPMKVHGDKLVALLKNIKVPKGDRENIAQAVKKYQVWLTNLNKVSGTKQEKLIEMIRLFNEYKYYIDFELIFCSKDDFLYRQKGQLKLDNTVIEEFLPILVNAYFENEFKGRGLQLGPSTCFSSVYFDSSMISVEPGAGMKIRQKDQDFVISKKLFVKASQHQDFTESLTEETNIAYVATECKTNLDKTMFQEAAATALDLKTSVPTAKYYLLCEWLDMTPISTGTTAIDEIIILRKAKRISSNIRDEFSTLNGREKHKKSFGDFLRSNPYAVDAFSRFLTHIENHLGNSSEEEALIRGYF